MNEEAPVTSARDSTFVLLVGIAVLYWARAVFIPLSLALLLSFLLAPLVKGLERRGLPRGLAVAASVLFSACVVSGVLALAMFQGFELSRALPDYQATIDTKLTLIRGKLDRLEHLPSTWNLLESRTGGSGQPVRVELVENRFAMLKSLTAPLVAQTLTAGLVLVFVVFMLMQWGDLRDRILRLSGQRHLSITTRALEEASIRVSRYLQSCLLVNAGTGVAFAVGLYFIGVPNAPLAGLLLATLRFVPYVGAWIAASFSLVLAFAANPSWAPSLLTLVLFLSIEILASQILEPLLYRARTGLSPVGVLISFVFWGWMWGGVGLLLATPLTVCLVVAGSHIPRLEGIAILLSDQGALSPWARLYHRLLALDPDEATTLVENHRTKVASTAELYDTLLAPTLAIAERDRQSKQVGSERSAIVYASMLHLIEYELPDAAGAPLEADTEVWCIPARSEADQLSSVMAARVLNEAGFCANSMSLPLSMSAVIERVALSRTRLVVVAALPQFAAVSVNERCRKLRELFPELRILAAVWTGDEVAPAVAARWQAAGADTIVNSFSALAGAANRLAVLTPSERQPRPFRPAFAEVNPVT